MRRFVPILVLFALAALAAVALAQVESAPAARLTATAAAGSFEVTNSDDGEPIFAATNIAPGGSVDGTVTIEDTGSAAATLVLRRGDIVDSPGLGGGLLSDRLELSVVDVTVPGAPRTVYSGPLATMPDQPAGRLEPGEARTFEFTATFPDAGEPSFQNAVQGASTTVAYAWIATEAGEGGGGEEGGGKGPGGGEGGAGAPGGGEVPAGGGNGGGGAGGRQGGGAAGGVAGRQVGLDLTVPKIRRALRSGRLVVWTRCDAACRLTVHGRLRAGAGGHHRGARVSFTQKGLAAAGPQRLRIPVPRKLRAWLRHQPPPKRLRARLSFTAVGADGQRDVVRKKVRLRAGGR
jgi:hypothetical protein